MLSWAKGMNAIVHFTRTLANTRVFGKHFAPNPTVDLYVRNALSPWIQRCAGDRRPIRVIGPTVFACDRRVVIVKNAPDRDLARLRSLRPEAVYYLLDDLLLRGDDDQGLPADYAARCRAFASERVPRIAEQTTELVTTSPRIAAQLPGLAASLIQPAHGTLCEDFAHFDRAGDSTRVVFSGTRSHLGDLRSIAGPLRALLRSDPRIHLTTFLGKHAPAELTKLANVDHRRPLPWPLYKRVLAGERFHVAILPTCDTAFNRARSANKILDHAALGAASILSDIEPLCRLTKPGSDALLCRSADDWAAAIQTLRRQPASARALAEAGVALARTIGSPREQAEFWRTRLGL